MTTLLDTLKGTILDTAVTTELETSLAELPGQIPAVPAGSIQQATSLIGQVKLPDLQALASEGADRLNVLVSSSLNNPDALWSALSNPLTELEQSLSTRLQQPIDSIFQQIRGTNSLMPDSPATLLEPISGPLRQVANLLVENPEIQHIVEFVGKIETLQSQLETAPTQLAVLLQEQIQAAMQEGTALVSPHLSALDQFISNLENQTKPAALTQEYQGVIQQLNPDGGSPVLDILATLDFASESAVTDVDGRLISARLLLEDFAQRAENKLGSAAELVPLFNVDAWRQRLTSSVTLSLSAPVNDLSSLLQPLQDKLEQAQEFVADLSLDNGLQPLHNLADQITDLLAEIDLEGVMSTITDGIEFIRGLVDSVRQAQFDLLAGLQNLANSLTQAIQAVDLNQIATSIDNALSSLDPIIAQVEGLIDSISTDLLNALSSLQSELGELQTNLTDPDGSFRKPIEDFFKTIRDAIPDDIPQKLEEAGQAIGDAVSGIGEISLDPVFDTVVEELEGMQRELQEIDAGSMGPLLQAALQAALAIFKSFDFQGEVEDYLTGEFDDAISAVTEPVIKALQDQVDGILGFLTANNPAELFAKLGLTEAFEAMVSSLDSFRPSEALQGFSDEVRQVATQLESFSPSSVLEPILQPLNQFRQFLQSISLESVFVQLEQALGRLNRILDSINVEAFVQDISQAITQLKDKLSGLVTVEGLLDFLQPLYALLIEAIDALDPVVFLNPLLEIRESMLTAIETVDTAAIGDIFASIGTQISRFELPNIRTAYMDRLQALSSGLQAVNLPERLLELRTTQQALRTALEARGEQADPLAERQRQRLLNQVDLFAPLPILSGSLVHFRTLQAGIVALVNELSVVLSDGSALQQPLEAFASRLRDLSLAGESGGADIKQALRDAVMQAYQVLGIDALTNLYNSLRETIQSFSPANITQAVTDLLAPVQALLGQLDDPGAVFAEITTLFGDLKTQLGSGLSAFLEQLRSDLQPIMDSIQSTLDGLDVQPIIEQLETRYEAILAMKDRLLEKFQELIDGLDVPYQQVTELISALNPGTILVEPLAATYQSILDKIEGVEIRTVFQPLIDALKQLRDELLAGIQRTSEAFQAFLSASPV